MLQMRIAVDAGDPAAGPHFNGRVVFDPADEIALTLE